MEADDEKERDRAQQGGRIHRAPPRLRPRARGQPPCKLGDREVLPAGRQGCPVELAVGQQRQSFHCVEPRRHEGRRQAPRQPPADGCEEDCAAGRHAEGLERGTPGLADPQHGGRGGRAGRLRARRQPRRAPPARRGCSPGRRRRRRARGVRPRRWARRRARSPERQGAPGGSAAWGVASWRATACAVSEAPWNAICRAWGWEVAPAGAVSLQAAAALRSITPARWAR